MTFFLEDAVKHINDERVRNPVVAPPAARGWVGILRVLLADLTGRANLPIGAAVAGHHNVSQVWVLAFLFAWDFLDARICNIYKGEFE